MKIGVFIGTRPEAIKLLPLFIQLKKNPEFSVTLINTGQHIDMLNQILRFFNVAPDIDLSIMKKSQSLSSLSSRLFERVDPLFVKNNFDLIIVQGDTTTAMICSLIAFYHQVPVAHIEAGLRSNDKYSPFPEEINRKLISNLTSIQFTPTRKATENLNKEGINLNIHEVGNTIVDGISYVKNLINGNITHYEKYFKYILDSRNRNVVVTIHRRENYQENIQSIFSALHDSALKHNSVNFIYPVHKNPILQTAARKYFDGIDNFKLIEPLPYDFFVYLILKSYFIISDSGGLQEEAPSLNKPILIIRDKTERPEIIYSGAGILCGTAYEKIRQNIDRLLESEDQYNRMINIKNPFGDGKTIPKIINILKNL